MTGVCKLCLEKRSLIRSHLIPRGVYALTRDDKGEHLVLNSKVMMHSTREIQAYLLCHECDNSLNKKGETWVVPKLARLDGTFPLLDALERLPPDAIQDDWAIYGSGRYPELDIRKLTHFALGIFWKASVHSWKGNNIEPMIDLGVYGERVRTFLRAEKPFPEDIALIVQLANRKSVSNFSGGALPHRGRCKEAHCFSFIVPCVQSSSLHPILVDDISSHVLKIASRMGTTAHISERLRRGK